MLSLTDFSQFLASLLETSFLLLAFHKPKHTKNIFFRFSFFSSLAFKNRSSTTKTTTTINEIRNRLTDIDAHSLTRQATQQRRKVSCNLLLLWWTPRTAKARRKCAKHKRNINLNSRVFNFSMICLLCDFYCTFFLTFWFLGSSGCLNKDWFAEQRNQLRVSAGSFNNSD